MELTYETLRDIFRDVLREEMAMGRYKLAPRFEGGKLEIKPADPGLKTKEISVDGFFKKVTSVRERLRVLEQKINNHKNLSHEDKVEFQGLITRAYGSLTTFNILFAEDEDKFHGQSGTD